MTEEPSEISDQLVSGNVSVHTLSCTLHTISGTLHTICVCVCVCVFACVSVMCVCVCQLMLVVCPNKGLCMCLCVSKPQAWTDPGHPVLQACQPNYHHAHDHPLDGEEHHQNFKIYNSGPRGFLGLFLMLIK